MSDAKLQRTVLRFKSKIDSGEYYEAHQTLRTITNRYVKSKQYPEAIDLLYQGSSILSKNKEYASASDLITYLIAVYEEADVKCTASNSDVNKIKLVELINLLPDSDPSLPDLAKQAINWSTTNGSKFGDNTLHHVFGVKFLNAVGSSTAKTSEDERMKLFAYAELHLILGTYESLPHYVDFLYSWFKQSAGEGAIQDPGAVLARAVINYAYLKNLKFVTEALERFLAKLAADYADHEIIENNGSQVLYFDRFPLINFLQLLVKVLGKEHAAGERFSRLYQQFKPLLAKHELLAPVEYIGRLYFGLNIGSSTASANPLASLMGGLFK